MTPRVTVAIPLYNKVDYIYDALHSVAMQSYRDLTILVVDDQSTDGSVEEVLRFRKEHPGVSISIVQNESNLGVQGNGNRCLEIPNTEFIARFDGDDIMPVNRIRGQVDFMDANQEVVQVGGYLQLIGNQEKLSKLPLTDEDIKAQMPIFNGISQGTSMFRREPVIMSGIRYDESGPAVGEDWLFFYKLGKLFTMANMPEVMDIYRIHDGNLSVSRNESYYQDINEVLKFILNDLGMNPTDDELLIHCFLRGQYRLVVNADSISRFTEWCSRLEEAYAREGLSTAFLRSMIARTYEQLYFQVAPYDKQAIGLLQKHAPMTDVHRKYLRRKKLKSWLGFR